MPMISPEYVLPSPFPLAAFCIEATVMRLGLSEYWIILDIAPVGDWVKNYDQTFPQTWGKAQLDAQELQIIPCMEIKILQSYITFRSPRQSLRKLHSKVRIWTWVSHRPIHKTLLTEHPIFLHEGILWLWLWISSLLYLRTEMQFSGPFLQVYTSRQYKKNACTNLGYVQDWLFSCVSLAAMPFQLFGSPFHSSMQHKTRTQLTDRCGIFDNVKSIVGFNSSGFSTGISTAKTGWASYHLLWKVYGYKMQYYAGFLKIK